MIHIKRDKKRPPRELNPKYNKVVAKEIEEAKRFFGNKEQERGQRRFLFKAYKHPNIRRVLTNMFHGKCAYCESKTSHVGALDIEHYRPKSSIIEASDHPGYWWLVNDWSNFLIACMHCNRKHRTKDGIHGKANRFPLKEESTRAYSPNDLLINESPLILNPCVDQPEDHFVYSDDGTIMSDTEKGKTTIVVLGLNRVDLVKRRREIIDEIKFLIQTLQEEFTNTKNIVNNPTTEGAVRRLQKMTHEEEEFAGLKRQYVSAFIKKFKPEEEAQENLSHTKTYTKTQKRAVKKEYENFTQSIGNISIEDMNDISSSYMLQEHFIEKIELINIKTFEQQTFDLIASEGSSVPWLMLLGENGTGKSTVLKSFCMNLCDGEYFQDMIRNNLINPNKFIRHGKKKGTIKVWITGSAKPRILEFKKNLVKFTSSDNKSVSLSLPLSDQNENTDVWTSPNFLLAYGATRLLPRGSKHEADHIESQFSRLDNLFNPFVPLVDAEKWLKGLNHVLFRRAAIVLKDLLRMSKNEEISKSRKGISIMINGSDETFNELSDGYQSVIALTSDVLQLVMNRWKNPDEARGIVLLDEVGAHLHPRWKMRIVSSLREALPNMQFIVSTHQPLCLRGMEKGEVVLMRRDADKNVEVITDLPNPKELRISQILTSVFGLSSTMDPELEAEFNRYHELRAKNERTPEEEIEMNALKTELNPDLLVGESMLDNLTLNVVKQQYHHYKNEKKQDDVEKLKEDTISAVQDLWNS